MGQGAPAECDSFGKRRDRAGHRAARAGHERETDFVLRRRISVGAGGGQFAENGLHERGINGWGLEGLAGRGPANDERLEIYPAEIAGKIGWGGRIRTFTIHINSVVSYRLDHAPAAFARS